MDRQQFDALARMVWTRQSRRAALATLLGATFLRIEPAPTVAKRKRKANAEATDRCFPGKHCAPGKGRNTSRCDFANSTIFKNKDVRGSNLSNSNFFAADLTGADFRGANLSGGCFVSTDLTGAKLGASVNLHNTVFCNTKMPDGRIDNSGCEGSTPCCHLRVQDCPDGVIDCYHIEFDGCTDSAGLLPGRVGTCYQFPMCCPCEHNDQGYWSEQCNAFFFGCADKCAAVLEQTLGGCFRCAGPP